MTQTLLSLVILHLLTLDNGNHYVKHCRRAKEGCEARVEQMSEQFLLAAEEQRLDPLLLVAIALHESGLNPDARGKKGERGPMQVLPSHLRRVDRAHDPYYIRTATELLRGYVDWCDGKLKPGLGTYNGGMNFGKCPRTTKYSRMVMWRYRQIKQLSAALEYVQ